MASSIGAGRTRAVLWAVFGLVVLVFLIDGGSCAIARAQVDEDGKTAARFAAQQIHDKPVNTQTAIAAYDAAMQALPNKSVSIVTDAPGTKEDFRVSEDGSVTLTVTREAPSLLFKHLPKLKEFTQVRITIVQSKLDM